MIKKNISYLCYAAILWATFSCKLISPETSGINALSSNDWFKLGVDRFYLAYLDAGDRIHPNFPQRFGEQFFFGIGCYGEARNPSTMVSILEAPNSVRQVNIALNKRTMLHQFPIYHGDGHPPKRGMCKILLGSAESPQMISNNSDLSKGGSVGGVATMFLGAAVPCVTSAVLVKTIFFSSAVAVAGAANTGGASIVALAPGINAQTVALGSSAYFCSVNTHKSFIAVSKYQMDENQKLFALAMDRAGKIALDKIRISGQYDAYQNLQKSRDLLEHGVASAIWNKTLVESFNEHVVDKFQNGWGTDSKFFDAVSSIEMEVKQSYKGYIGVEQKEAL
jgi:hypothetical protein